jgi:hypothetical protein
MQPQSKDKVIIKAWGYVLGLLDGIIKTKLGIIPKTSN